MSYHTSTHVFLCVWVSFVVHASTYSVIPPLGTIHASTCCCFDVFCAEGVSQNVCIINCSSCHPLLSFSLLTSIANLVSLLLRGWRSLHIHRYIYLWDIFYLFTVYTVITPHKDLQINTYIYTHVQTSISPTQIWTVPETCLKQAHKFLWHRQCRECTGRRYLSCKPVKGVLTLQSGGLLYIPLLAISVYTCGFCDLLQVCFSEGWTLLRGNACNAVPRTLQLAFTFNLKKAEVRPRTCKLVHLQRARVEGLVYRNDVNPVYIWRACHPD